MNTQQLLTQLISKLGAQRQFLVAFSGGLDSCVLLHLLTLMRRQCPELMLRAVHIHHGLSHFADQWAIHCQQQCQDWHIPLVVKQVQLDGLPGGIEAAARTARYNAFSDVLSEGEVLLTAQHLDDQCETFLLALKRGSGPAGLSAMASRSYLGQHLLLRPLLGVSRQQLEVHAQEHRLVWVDDESNQNSRFDRNFLRLNVLPLLNQRWPHFASATARSASLCAEQERLLDELLAESLANLLDNDNSLAIAELAICSPTKRDALLRRWIALFGVTMPARDRLQTLWNEVALSREDAEAQLQLGSYQIRRFRQRLYLLPLMVALGNVHLSWPCGDSLMLPDGLGELFKHGGRFQIRAPKTTEQVSVRFTAQGRVRILGRNGSRSLKKLWQEFGIPPWQRQRIPLIYYDNSLISAVSLFVTEEGRITTNQEETWQVEWRKV